MKSQLVFQEENEVQRLSVQHQLLQKYEADLFSYVLQDKSGLAVLDVGSNNGAKTHSRFAHAAIERVIGLEYNEKMAQEAQHTYGSDAFSFCQIDVEAPDFTNQLSALSTQHGLAGFDLIHLSLILMHLKDPRQLLLNLLPFLKPDGHLVLIEANDAVSTLSPDPKGLLKDFLQMLDRDRFAGKRSMGGKLEPMLKECGYGDIHVWHEGVSAGPGELEEKEKIFATFFSYLPEDVALLRKLEPQCVEYRRWAQWLDAHDHELYELVTQPESKVFMGMKMLTCRRCK